MVVGFCIHKQVKNLHPLHRNMSKNTWMTYIGGSQITMEETAFNIMRKDVHYSGREHFVHRSSLHSPSTASQKV